MSSSSSSTLRPNQADGIMTKPIEDNSIKGHEKKKKSIIPKIFGSKKNDRESSEEDNLQSDGNDNESELRKIESRKKAFLEDSTSMRRGLSESRSSPGIESLNLSSFDRSIAPETMIQDVRVFVSTWNVGGNTPNQELNLEDFLQIEGSADLYVLGFQEIVPLNAGNVLVIEDNEPASKWLAIISHALNKPYHDSVLSSSSPESSTSSKHSKSNNSSSTSANNIFYKPSLKELSKKIKAESDLLKSCNCSWESSNHRSSCNRPMRKVQRDPCASPFGSNNSPKRLSYQLVASKQMVGIFLTVWARREIVREIAHLRISCMGRGIMGCLGNKGCIAISMTLHKTSFCFVCSHLASGEKEGDEVRRNSDVAEIIKGTQFPRMCRNTSRVIPERIIDHDRMIWLGDLNYRVGLSYEEARLLLEDNDWDSLLEKDQLNVEREAGRIFNGWNEGKIMFAPTYKYSINSDSYTGETTKSKRKRRTPAWCDRILWRGKGIEQLSYVRGESRFSDHRPVCAVFAVEVEVKNNRNNNNNTNTIQRLRKGFSCTGPKLEYEDCMPHRHSFCEF